MTPSAILAHVQSVGCTDIAMLAAALAGYDEANRREFKSLVLEMIRDGRLESINGAIRIPKADPEPPKPRQPKAPHDGPVWGGRPIYKHPDGTNRTYQP